MFEGEKTVLFWVGLNISGLASMFLLFILWNIAYTRFRGLDLLPTLFNHVQALAVGASFGLIGFYMMKSGVKKKARADNARVVVKT